MAFKFTDEAGLSYLTSGSLRFRTLSYFRLYEHAFQDFAIGDSQEAAATTLTPYYEVHLASGGRVTSVGETRYNAIEAAVWSFTEGDFTKVEALFCDPERIPSPYSFCVEFDPEALVAALRDGATVGGRPFQEVFPAALSGTVRYEETFIESGPNDTLIPDAFRKPPRYGAQRESRIVLPRDALEGPKHWDVQIAQPASVFTPRPVRFVPSSAIAGPRFLTPDEAWREIVALHDELEPLFFDRSRPASLDPFSPNGRHEIERLDRLRQAAMDHWFAGAQRRLALAMLTLSPLRRDQNLEVKAWRGCPNGGAFTDLYRSLFNYVQQGRPDG